MQKQETDMKPCCKCKREKNFSDFSKNITTEDGLQACCKKCKADYQREYRKTVKGRDSMQESYQRRKEKISEYWKTSKGKAAHKRACENHIQDYPERHKARTAVGHAIRDGRLERPIHCEGCFQEKFVHGHHEDYSKLLDVDWLCIKCHTELHKDLILV